MIVTCPACATCYDISSALIHENGSLVRCAHCGHSWVETSAVPAISGKSGDDRPAWAIPHMDGTAAPPARELVTLEAEDLEAPLFDYRLEEEARRLLQAHNRAAEERARYRATMFKAAKGWGALAAAVVVLIVASVVWRTEVVKALPATAALYEMAGIDVNVRGLLVRDVTYEFAESEGKPVLMIRGQIANISGTTQPLPPLRFQLRDAQTNPLYSWSLSIRPEPLAPGEFVPFTTKIGKPPVHTAELDIHFAPSSRFARRSDR